MSRTSTRPETSRPPLPVVEEDDGPFPLDIRNTSVPMVVEEPAEYVKAVQRAAADNAQPPAFLTPFAAPSWAKKESFGAFALNAGLYLSGSVAAVAYWASVIVVWAVVHLLLWVIGHPFRALPAAAVLGAAYLYLTHR